jgi:hypothetical protein
VDHRLNLTASRAAFKTYSAIELKISLRYELEEHLHHLRRKRQLIESIKMNISATGLAIIERRGACGVLSAENYCLCGTTIAFSSCSSLLIIQ